MTNHLRRNDAVGARRLAGSVFALAGVLLIVLCLFAASNVHADLVPETRVSSHVEVQTPASAIGRDRRVGLWPATISTAQKHVLSNAYAQSLSRNASSSDETMLKAIVIALFFVMAGLVAGLWIYLARTYAGRIRRVL